MGSEDDAPLSKELEHAKPSDEAGRVDTALARAAAREKLFGKAKETVTIGRFVVQERLGAGAMGTVYLALDPELDRLLAVKVLRAAGRDTDALRRRMLREAKAMAKLRHPNVITVYEVGEADDEAYIAMEYVEGHTLREWLAEERAWPAILDAFAQAGDGLAAAHRAGLTHRDFKPENVLIDGEGRVQVTDFGVAARELLSEEGAPASVTATELASAGTPRYMAPEQYTGAGDARSDQFSFCVALYEAAYGKPPFDGETRKALQAAASTGPAKPPRTPGIPVDVGEALMRGMAPAPEERFASMTDLLQALRNKPQRPRAPLTPYALLGVAVLAGGAYVWNEQRTRTERSDLVLPESTMTVTASASASAVPTPAPSLTSAPTAAPSASGSATPPATVKVPAGPTNPCLGTRACGAYGRCTPRGDKCVATNNAMCQRSGGCRQTAHCTNVGDHCELVSSADCAKHQYCGQSGRCVFVNGACRIGSDADCQRSQKCKKYKKCRRHSNGISCVE